MTETVNEVTVTLEGFTYHVDYGYTFLCKPIVQEHPDTTDPDHVTEQYCIDVSLGEKPFEEEKESGKKIRNAFYKVRKRNTEYRVYWKRVVKIYVGDQDRVFDVIESVGEG